MSELQNSSFIPKQGSGNVGRKIVRQKIFIGTLVIQIFFFATLLAAFGTFIYERNLDKKLASEVLSFEQAIDNFSEEDMKKIVDIDNRINQTENRLSNTASMVSIFEAIESATLQSVQIKNLTMEREGDSRFLVEAEMNTDVFDSVMFQRGVLQRDEKLNVNKISDLSIVKKSETEDGLDFKATLEINTSDVPHNYFNAIPESVPEISTSTETDVLNQELSDESEINQ